VALEAREMLESMYMCALQFELEHKLNEESDLEAEAMISALSRSF